MSVNGKKIFPIILISVIIIVVACIAVGSTIGNSKESNMQPNSPVSTENQAVEIALPLAQAYAQEYNFDIISTKATFVESAKPYWFVEVEFKVGEWAHSKIERTGYEIAVWVDTGKIYHHGSMEVVIIDSEATNGGIEENVKFTLDKAIEVALPLVQAYAQESNYAPTTLTSSCHLDNRPYWDVIVKFEVIENGVGGYYVSVWADTGEIRSHDVLNTVGF